MSSDGRMLPLHARKPLLHRVAAGDLGSSMNKIHRVIEAGVCILTVGLILFVIISFVQFQFIPWLAFRNPEPGWVTSFDIELT